MSFILFLSKLSDRIFIHYKFGFAIFVAKMNDLMSKSFLSYVELKKQAQIDDDLQAHKDIEKGQLSPRDEDNLSAFFQEVDAIKTSMKEISNLLLDLQNLNQEAKSTHSIKLLRGIRDRMDSDVVSVLRVAKLVKDRLESLDKSNVKNRKISVAFKEGSAVDRTRSVVTNGLRIKLREIMNDFQTLREKIMLDYKEYLKRRYFNATGEAPCEEELIERMVLGSGNVAIFEGKTEVYLENKERHEAAMDIQRSLQKLHQVFLDMAVLVEAQGEKIDDIEHNVAIAGSYIAGGTNSLHYAKQMKKRNRWACCVWAVVVIIILVCIISMLCS